MELRETIPEEGPDEAAVASDTPDRFGSPCQVGQSSPGRSPKAEPVAALPAGSPPDPLPATRELGARTSVFTCGKVRRLVVLKVKRESFLVAVEPPPNVRSRRPCHTGVQEPVTKPSGPNQASQAPAKPAESPGRSTKKPAKKCCPF